MKNHVREKMLSGEKTVGTFFELGSATAAECIGLAGLDYLIIDQEHGPFNPQTTLTYVQAAKLYGVTPFARAQEISRPAILKLLDAGVMGLIIPCVRTRAELEEIVEYGKYAPLGRRGVASAAGTSFWYGEEAQHGMEQYFEISNRETLLIPQCETVECLEHIEEFAGIDGIDGFFVGPYDLSTAMNKPGQFDDPEVIAAIDRVRKACRAAHKFSFIYAGTEEKAREHLEKGFDSVAFNLDAIMLTESYRAAKGRILGV